MAVDPTPNWGIHRWDDTAPVAPLQDFFNTQADDLEAALDGAATGWFLNYDTKAAMDLVPGTRVGQHANVSGDTTAANNGDYVWNGGAWSRLPRITGIAVASVSQTLTTSAVALSGLSLTVNTPAVPVRIRATVQLNNAGSGADRTASLQLFEDTTALGLARTFTVPLVGSGGMVAAVLTLNRTPSAGSHTYTVKASASIASAITLGDCDIEVTVL